MLLRWVICGGLQVGGGGGGGSYSPLAVKSELAQSNSDCPHFGIPEILESRTVPLVLALENLRSLQLENGSFLVLL